MDNKADKQFKPWSKLLLFGGAVFLWLAVTGLLYLASEPNEIGDSFGAVNALFSGLAFAGLIVTIQQQHEELQETRREMEGQTKQMNLQARLMALSTSLSVQPEIIRLLLNDIRFEHPELHQKYLSGAVGVELIDSLIDKDNGGEQFKSLSDNIEVQNERLRQATLRKANTKKGSLAYESLESDERGAIKTRKQYETEIADMRKAEKLLIRLRSEVKQMFDDKRKLESLQKETEQISRPSATAPQSPQ